MKTLTLKNSFFIDIDPQNGVIGLTSWLAKQLLHGSASRSRTRFIKLVSDRLSEIDKEINKLREECSAKNEKGEIIYFDKDGKETTDKEKSFRFKIDDQKKFNEEWDKYMQEDYVLDITPASKDVIYGVRQILFDTHDEFNGVMAARYDQWCEAFENIKEA